MRDDPAFRRAIMEGMPDPSTFIEGESESDVELVSETEQVKKVRALSSSILPSAYGLQVKTRVQTRQRGTPAKAEESSRKSGKARAIATTEEEVDEPAPTRPSKQRASPLVSP